MKIYVAGPIRHQVGKNQHNFRCVKQKLEKLGHVAITPFDLATQAEIDESEDHITQAICRKYCKRDVDQLLSSDAIYLLKGWEHSVGARAEHAVALWLQLVIMYE